MKEDDISKKFSGEWLLLFNDEINDHSANVEDILKLAEEKFPSENFPDDEIKISKVLSGDVRLQWFHARTNIYFWLSQILRLNNLAFRPVRR